MPAAESTMQAGAAVRRYGAPVLADGSAGGIPEMAEWHALPAVAGEDDGVV
jgi:hypothetical protein